MDESISKLLNNLVDDEDSGKVSVGEIIDRFEDRGFGPLLLIPSLIALLPTGAIPGVPSVCGITLFLICIQVAVGRQSPWLPHKLTKQNISSDKLENAIDKAEPQIKRVEKLLRPRFTQVSQSPMKNIIAGYCAIAALCMIPLEALPFAVAVPAFALCITAVGMTNRDGVFIGVGSVMQLGTLYLVLSAVGVL